MVHALRESWRVLVPGGSLIDLRPLAANSPVQVVTGDKIVPAGQIDDSKDRLDDRAAAEAIRRIVHEGWFALEQEERFDYVSYWNTLEEMQRYIEEKRSSLILPEQVLAEAERLVTGSSTEARLRIPFRMVISRYRKTPGGGYRYSHV